MADELDAFLGSKEGKSEAAQAPTERPAEPPAPEAPPAKPEPPATPTEAPAKAPEAEPEDDLPVTGEDTRTVQFSALEKVRNDWRSKYAAEQVRAEMLQKQLEEIKKQPAMPAQPPQQFYRQLPDFNTDPRGYIQALDERNYQDRLNERLNLSEVMLRDKLGDEKVDQYVNDFRAFAEKDPQLWHKLYDQRAPYQWLVGEMDRRRMHAEIGDDPVSYEQKLRAKWEAEMAAKAPPAATVSPAANQPPSLAAARSVAGRTTSSFTGPPSLDDIFSRPDRRAR